VSLAEAAGEPFAIELAPLATVTGRLMSSDNGAPLADISFEALFLNKEAKQSTTVRTGKTEADGSFELTLPFGGTYHIMIDRGPLAGRTLVEEITPEPGQEIDVGELKR
jgi:hypothetical protein